MSSNSSSNYAISASGDNFIANVGGSNAVGEEVVEPFSVLTNSPSNPLIAKFARGLITLGSSATRVFVQGPTGLGLVYDDTNNLPAPSPDIYQVINTDNLLVGVPYIIPPGNYIFETFVVYSGAGKVLPAGAAINLVKYNAITDVSASVAAFIVPVGLTLDGFEDLCTIITSVATGDTFSIVASPGINLGADGFLFGSVHAFCGDLPISLAGSVRRSRRAI
jgi:hypothetical protein